MEKWPVQVRRVAPYSVRKIKETSHLAANEDLSRASRERTCILEDVALKRAAGDWNSDDALNGMGSMPSVFRGGGGE
jgi:hypothetical protein